MPDPFHHAPAANDPRVRAIVSKTCKLVPGLDRASFAGEVAGLAVGSLADVTAIALEHAQRRMEYYRALQANPLDSTAAEDYLVSEIGTGSSQRPHSLLRLHNRMLPRLQNEAGAAFWNWVSACWACFDAIPYGRYGAAFRQWRPAWTAQCMTPANQSAFNMLPEVVVIYRGQDARAKPGLSWTLSLPVAEGFAYGHRGLRCPHPTVLCATVLKSDVALVVTDREESEVVLFRPPHSYLPIAAA